MFVQQRKTLYRMSVKMSWMKSKLNINIGIISYNKMFLSSSHKTWMFLAGKYLEIFLRGKKWLSTHQHKYNIQSGHYNRYLKQNSNATHIFWSIIYSLIINRCQFHNKAEWRENNEYCVWDIYICVRSDGVQCTVLDYCLPTRRRHYMARPSNSSTTQHTARYGMHLDI